MVAGLAAMLAVRASSPSESGGGAGRLVPTVNTNILIDRVLIGLSAALGAGTGLLFAISLAPEMGLLGLTAGQTLSRSWPGRRVAVAAGGVGAAITAAGALGWALSRTDQAVSTAILGLGASVIVYLVLEELLREVHETDTGPLEVAVLFGAVPPFLPRRHRHPRLSP